MEKYKRPSKYPGMRSIPLRNPHTIRWPLEWTPNKNKSISVTQHNMHATWYRYDKNGVAHKITCEPQSEPKYVLMHSLDTYLELRMYWHNNNYWFAELNRFTKKLWRSRSYSGRAHAMRVYDLHIAGVPNAILWLESKPLGEVSEVR